MSDSLERYHSRLASVLDAPELPPTNTPVLTYPQASKLRIEAPELTIALPEFYALQGCPVSTLIAQRNTALGKIQLPSQRYVYEVELIAGLQECLALQQNGDIQAQLAVWLESKLSRLPYSWANLIQNSKELKHALSRNQGFIRGDEQDNFTAFRQAFELVVELQERSAAEKNKIEESLKVMQTSPLLATMWVTQLLLTESLRKTNTWLERHTQSLNCDRPSGKQKLTYLENVFRRYFVEDVQANASALNDYHYRLTPALNTLRNSPYLSSEFKALLEQRDKEFSDYQAVMAEHIQLWQGIFGKCSVANTQR